ncbi:hypothetical protein ACH419_36490 [Streptomyces bobili]|uniref:hypothetical protein n=1 Tax=Streptomyces bobili TaxID=67280 RepID=UPI0037B1272B
MLFELLRNALARLLPAMDTALYSCSRCGLRVEITDYPDRIVRLLDVVTKHQCKPKPKAL